jgi:CBS domain-containing protein
MEFDRPSMGDSLHYLNQLGGVPESMAAHADRLRGTRNALAHNPDLMLRPDAGGRIIESVERIVRMAAETAYHLAHRPLETIRTDATIAEARERLLALGHRQLIAVDEHRRLVDLLTYRDIVAVEGAPGTDGSDVTVEDAVKSRDYCAAAAVPRNVSIAEVADILVDERISAAIVTEHGRIGERPLGIITRGDLLRHR